jgi:hypothetical protein
MLLAQVEQVLQQTVLLVVLVETQLLLAQLQQQAELAELETVALETQQLMDKAQPMVEQPTIEMMVALVVLVKLSLSTGYKPK